MSNFILFRFIRIRTYLTIKWKPSEQYSQNRNNSSSSSFIVCAKSKQLLLAQIERVLLPTKTFGPKVNKINSKSQGICFNVCTTQVSRKCFHSFKIWRISRHLFAQRKTFVVQIIKKEKRKNSHDHWQLAIYSVEQFVYRNLKCSLEISQHRQHRKYFQRNRHYCISLPCLHWFVRVSECPFSLFTLHSTMWLMPILFRIYGCWCCTVFRSLGILFSST